MVLTCDWLIAPPWSSPAIKLANPLKNLSNSPLQVWGNFNCSNTLIKNLEGCTQQIGENLDIENTQISKTETCAYDVANIKLNPAYKIKSDIICIINNKISSNCGDLILSEY